LKLNLDHNLCDYLDDIEETDYFNLNIRRMLAHTAGLVPFIAFHEKTMRRGQLKFDIYSSVPTPLHTVEVAKDLFMRADYRDSIKIWIKKSMNTSTINILIIEKNMANSRNLLNIQWSTLTKFTKITKRRFKRVNRVT
jgi:hypothetical protein